MSPEPLHAKHSTSNTPDKSCPHSSLPCLTLPCCPPPPSLLQRFTEEICLFQEKVLKRSGLGQETYVPTCEQSTLMPALVAARVAAHPQLRLSRHLPVLGGADMPTAQFTTVSAAHHTSAAAASRPRLHPVAEAMQGAASSSRSSKQQLSLCSTCHDLTVQHLS